MAGRRRGRGGGNQTAKLQKQLSNAQDMLDGVLGELGLADGGEMPTGDDLGRLREPFQQVNTLRKKLGMPPLQLSNITAPKQVSLKPDLVMPDFSDRWEILATALKDAEKHANDDEKFQQAMVDIDSAIIAISNDLVHGKDADALSRQTNPQTTALFTFARHAAGTTILKHLTRAPATSLKIRKEFIPKLCAHHPLESAVNDLPDVTPELERLKGGVEETMYDYKKYDEGFTIVERSWALETLLWKGRSQELLRMGMRHVAGYEEQRAETASEEFVNAVESLIPESLRKKDKPGHVKPWERRIAGEERVGTELLGK